MARFAAILICLAMATPAMAQDPCPFTEARRIWRDFRPLSHLMIAVTYRKECGVMSDRDHAAIRSIHLARGCPIDSELGDYFTDFLNAPLTEVNRHPGLDILRRGDPVGYHGFCRMAEALSWPEGSAAFLLGDPAEIPSDAVPGFQGFWAHLDAMQNELTWLLTR